MKMKNLFDFAPKELTQDGFLRWVFENYEEPELRELCHDLILFLTRGDKGEKGIDIFDENFKKMNSWSQVAHMDVGCDFYFGDDERIATRYLVIEDKTTSNEHHQLETYNKVIERWDEKAGKGERAIKVFYKTTPVEKDEADRVAKAGWRLIPLKDIVGFWQKYIEHPNLIVKFYAKHISEIGKSSANESKPTANDIVAWTSFFRKRIQPALEAACPDACVVCDKTRYGYAYLNVIIKGADAKRVPYLEIRSRDLLGDVFEARILKYGKDIDGNSFKRLRDCIAGRKSKLFRANWGEKRLQQAGHTSKSDKRLSAKNEDELLQSIIECAEEYLEIVKEWL